MSVGNSHSVLLFSSRVLESVLIDSIFFIEFNSDFISFVTDFNLLAQIV